MIDCINQSRLQNFVCTDPEWSIHKQEVWICFWSSAAWPPASCTRTFPLWIPVLYGELIPSSFLNWISPPPPPPWNKAPVGRNRGFTVCHPASSRRPWKLGVKRGETRDFLTSPLSPSPPPPLLALSWLLFIISAARGLIRKGRRDQG